MPKRRKKFDYSGKKYSNPFFRAKRKKGVFSVSSGKSFKAKKRTWRSKLIFLTLAAVFVCLVWLFYFSSVFNVTSVEVVGNSKIAESDIKDAVWRQTNESRFFIFKQKNLNLFDEDELAANLNGQYYFENLSINKKFPGTIIINLKEKEYSAVWYESDKYYYIDNEGNIFSEADPLQIKRQNYPLIENRREGKIDGKAVKADDGSIDYIVSLFKELKNNRKNFKIDRFILDSDFYTVKLKLLEGPEIYFNTKEDIKKQIAKLLVIVGEKLKDDFINKEYIDLRYGDRVYYR